MFGFFQQTFTIPFQNLPKFFDDREVLKSHIFRLDGASARHAPPPRPPAAVQQLARG